MHPHPGNISGAGGLGSCFKKQGPFCKHSHGCAEEQAGVHAEKSCATSPSSSSLSLQLLALLAGHVLGAESG